jgi:hypothetical protein
MWEVRAKLPNVNAETKLIYGDIFFKIVLGAGLNNFVERALLEKLAVPRLVKRERQRERENTKVH